MALKLDNKALKKVQDLFSALINMMEERAESADILLIDHKESSINRDNDNIDFSEGIDFGIKLRAFDGEKYIETHTTEFDEQKLTLLAKTLVKDIPVKNKKKNKTIKQSVKKFSEKCKINPAKITLQEKIKLTNDVVAKVKNFSDKITAARVLYEENAERRIYASNSKFYSQDLMKSTLVMIAYVKTADGETRYSYDSAVRNGFEIKKEVDKMIKKVGKDALSMLSAKKIKPGKYTAILSPDLSGLLAHESFGHGMESDTAFNDRAKSVGFIGKKIAPSYVSIIDYPKISTKHGTYFFDDEGNLAKKTYLVRSGVVKDFLTEDFSANMMKIKKSGNARCESFDHKSYARMSNTYFEKGKESSKKMIASVKDGIYLIHASGGMEDPKSWGVQLQGVFGQRIKDGKLVDEYYTDIGVTGYLLTILSNIRKVSKEFEIEGGGSCGKGHKEWVPVSSGGPFLLIDEVELS